MLTRRIKWVALSVALLFATSCTTPPSLTGGDATSRIQNIVVIYAENRSFDHLYGLFPGAEGIADAKPGSPWRRAGKNVSTASPNGWSRRRKRRCCSDDRRGQRFLVRVFLRRYVTWCARRRRFAQMQGAAILFADC